MTDSAIKSALEGVTVDPGDGCTPLPLEYVLIRGFSAMGWKLPATAAGDMLDSITTAVAALRSPPETVKAHPFKASLGTALCTECSGTESAPWHRPPDKAQDLAQALILTRVELEKARERIVTMRAAIQAAMASSWESPCEPYHCVSNAAYQQMRNSIAAPDTEGR